MGCCCSKCWTSITLVFAHLACVVNYVSLAAQRDTCRPDVVHYCHTLSGRMSHHCLAWLPPSPQKKENKEYCGISNGPCRALKTLSDDHSSQNGIIRIIRMEWLHTLKGYFTVIKCALNLSIWRCADAIMMLVHHSALRFITAASRPLLHLGLLHHWDEILENLKRQ